MHYSLHFTTDVWRFISVKNEYIFWLKVFFYLTFDILQHVSNSPANGIIRKRILNISLSASSPIRFSTSRRQAGQIFGNCIRVFFLCTIHLATKAFLYCIGCLSFDLNNLLKYSGLLCNRCGCFVVYWRCSLLGTEDSLESFSLQITQIGMG